MILQVAKRIANVRFTEEKGKNWTKFAGFLPFFQILTFCKKGNTCKNNQIEEYGAVFYNSVIRKHERKGL